MYKSEQRSIYVAILRKIPKGKKREVKLQYYPLSVLGLVNDIVKLSRIIPDIKIPVMIQFHRAK